MTVRKIYDTDYPFAQESDEAYQVFNRLARYAYSIAYHFFRSLGYEEGRARWAAEEVMEEYVYMEINKLVSQEWFIKLSEGEQKRHISKVAQSKCKSWLRGPRRIPERIDEWQWRIGTGVTPERIAMAKEEYLHLAGEALQCAKEKGLQRSHPRLHETLECVVAIVKEECERSQDADIRKFLDGESVREEVMERLKITRATLDQRFHRLRERIPPFEKLCRKLDKGGD